jgi:hypothetical protein
MPDATIQIIGLISGIPTPFDGQYIVEYDPERDGKDPDGLPMWCHLVTTPNRTDALHLSNHDAVELWRQVSQREPLRADGRPNRPLTAFTVEIKNVDTD